MRLISADQALGMLEATAPRAWCKRLLRWLIFEEGLELYARKGTIREVVPKIRLTLAVRDRVGEEESATDLLTADFDADVAKRWETAGDLDYITINEEIWNNEHRLVLDILILYASEIDFDIGEMSAEVDPSDIYKSWPHLDEEPFLAATEDRSTLQIELGDLSFRLDQIEMLAPSASAPAPLITEPVVKSEPRLGGPGRTPKWNWTGALAHVAAIANTPDGLPHGHGAQAAIARVMAEWFQATAGSEPGATELKRRANEVLSAMDDHRAKDENRLE